MAHKNNSKIKGQALLEFALIITVLLMMMFLIIESARILWAWNTVQNAAREGARYAITGQFDNPCDSTDLPKFSPICDGDDPRVASIINVAHQGLSGLPLNEASGLFEDDNYYQIEVWGVNDQGQIQSSYGGIPNTPVVVRAFYRVPIITPLLQPIVPSIPVFGQVTMNNESFGQLGNANQGQGVPPELPPIPTAGVTPSPTFTPTNTPSPSPGPTSTDTPEPTLTPSATPDYCGLEIEESPVAGNSFVFVTGEIGRFVRIINVTTGATLGTGTLLDRNNHACDGFLSIPLSGPLIVDHIILAESDNLNDNFDTAFVLPGTPTPTISPTPTVVPTDPATATPTQTLTPTPSGPFIVLLPNCGSAPNVQFTVQGFNWPTNTTISLYWDTNQLQSTINTGASTNFSQTWQKFGLTADGSVHTYDVVAIASGISPQTATFTTPCENVTPTPVTFTPTPSPAPADLLIVGPPELISTPPIVAYRPVDFRVVISNTGDIPVESQFFVDVFLDPTTILTNSIPIDQSGGYQGVGSLAGRASRVITISVPLGFKNEPIDHHVYGMVDSLRQINESDETNNISSQLVYDQVTPAPTPTPTVPASAGADSIVGVVYRPSDKGLSPLLRARVLLVEVSTSNIIGSTTSDPLSGIYRFNNLPQTEYTVMACGSLNTNLGTTEYFGWRTSITLPYAFPVNIYTNDSIPCPAEFP